MHRQRRQAAAGGGRRRQAAAERGPVPSHPLVLGVVVAALHLDASAHRHNTATARASALMARQQPSPGATRRGGGVRQQTLPGSGAELAAGEVRTTAAPQCQRAGGRLPAPCWPQTQPSGCCRIHNCTRICAVPHVRTHPCPPPQRAAAPASCMAGSCIPTPSLTPNCTASFTPGLGQWGVHSGARRVQRHLLVCVRGAGIVAVHALRRRENNALQGGRRQPRLRGRKTGARGAAGWVNAGPPAGRVRHQARRQGHKKEIASQAVKRESALIFRQRGEKECKGECRRTGQRKRLALCNETWVGWSGWGLVVDGWGRGEERRDRGAPRPREKSRQPEHKHKETAPCRAQA